MYLLQRFIFLSITSNIKGSFSSLNIQVAVYIKLISNQESGRHDSTISGVMFECNDGKYCTGIDACITSD